MHSQPVAFFPSVWKNNDAASEPRRRHSATHGLNGERRRDELSSFISSGRENTTGEKKKNKECVAFVQLFLPGRRHGRPRGLKRSGGCAVVICNYAAALVHRAARIRGARPLKHKGGSRRRGGARSAGVPRDKRLPAGVRETFLKVCLTKMSIKEH